MFSFIIASVDITCEDKAAQQLLLEPVNYYFFAITECKSGRGARCLASITGAKVCIKTTFILSCPNRQYIYMSLINHS